MLATFSRTVCKCGWISRDTQSTRHRYARPGFTVKCACHAQTGKAEISWPGCQWHCAAVQIKRFIYTTSLLGQNKIYNWHRYFLNAFIKKINYGWQMIVIVRFDIACPLILMSCTERLIIASVLSNDKTCTKWLVALVVELPPYTVL